MCAPLIFAKINENKKQIKVQFMPMTAVRTNHKWNEFRCQNLQCHIHLFDFIKCGQYVGIESVLLYVDWETATMNNVVDKLLMPFQAGQMLKNEIFFDFSSSFLHSNVFIHFQCRPSSMAHQRTLTTTKSYTLRFKLETSVWIICEGNTLLFPYR